MARYFLAFALDSFWRALVAVAVAWAAGGAPLAISSAAFLVEESIPPLHAPAATDREMAISLGPK